MLTFLVVGGGPTGVELAGAIAELARQGMEKEFRRFDPASARIVLVQAGSRLLPSFPEKLSAETRSALERLGVEVRTDSRVEAIDALGVQVSGTRIDARTVFWAAGVTASPAARWLGRGGRRSGARAGRSGSLGGRTAGGVRRRRYGSLERLERPAGTRAGAGGQAGRRVRRARHQCRVDGGVAPPPFAYRHLGSMATIGRKAAVVDFGWLRLSGAVAWWLWGFVHVAFLVGLRNRVSVAFDWFWAYLTYGSSTRLITGGETDAPSSEGTPAVPRGVRAA